MTDIYDEPEKTEKMKYRGEAQATEEEMAEVGGEKTLPIENKFFQSDEEAQAEAEKRLARLKTRKKYFEATSVFCPVPLERRDIVTAGEFISKSKTIWHKGLVRGMKLSVTPSRQSLTLMLEE